MNNKKLLSNIRFWPLFWTQFFGALNDNLFKLALVTIVLTQAESYTLWGLDVKALVILSTGLFILPFFLFSTTAGQLADKYDKARLIRYIKLLEISIMSLATVGFLTQNIGFLVLILFLMGTQSTLFGPLKYSILPQHLPDEALVAANGLIEMATFLAILIGTIFGGVLVLITPGGATIISIVVLTVAVTGWMFSRKIPDAAPNSPATKIHLNFVAETFRQLAHARHNRDVFIAVIAISWFWYFGATILTLLPPISSEQTPALPGANVALALLPTIVNDLFGLFPSPGNNSFRGSAYVYTVLLTFLSLGIGTGSVLCDKLVGKLKTGNFLVPIGAVGLAVFGIDFYFAATHMVAISPDLIDHIVLTDSATLAGTAPEILNFHPAASQFVTVSSFLSSFTAWRILFDLTFFGISAGFYIVPLYVMLQQRSDVQHRSRMIAINNIMNALFIVVSSIAGLILKKWFSLTEIILITALLGIIVCSIIFLIKREFIHDLLSRLRVSGNPE